MSQKKKIKIKTDTEETATDQETEEQAPADDNLLKSKTRDAETALKEMEAKYEAKEEEARETYDRLLRVSADFENYKKRAAREMEEFRKFANQSLLKEMLTVVDNLELALNSVNTDQANDKQLAEGLDLTHKEILRVFEKFSVKPIDSKGKPFDPTFHEAVMQEETDAYPENTVTKELQKGYLIHERLLRPAMVVVAKPKTENTD